MVKESIKEAETRMKGAIQALEDDLSGIRTGRASPALVERLHIEYYGMPTPLMQLATISIPEARAILIRPFDATSLKAIEKAILASELGLTPNNDGKVIRLNVPPLTEERRRDLIKLIGKLAEDGRVALRHERRHGLEALKKEQKDGKITEDELSLGEKEVQKLTDQYTGKIEALVTSKEAELLKV